MKTNIVRTLGLGFLLAIVCGNLPAQNTPTTGNSSVNLNPQTVANNVVTNPNVLVVTGKIMDAFSKEPITNAKINLHKFGSELLEASIDKNGNYALALNKEELGEPIRVIFKVPGYKKYVVKDINKNSNYLDVNVYLQPNESDEKSSGKVTYKMDDDPFNPLVIKMQ